MLLTTDGQGIAPVPKLISLIPLTPRGKRKNGRWSRSESMASHAGVTSSPSGTLTSMKGWGGGRLLHVNVALTHSSFPREGTGFVAWIQ